MKTKAQVSSYKGHPTISLDSESRFPFTFGLAKAKLIVEHIDAIREFVQRNEPTQPDRFDMAVEDRMAKQAGV